MRKPNGYWTIGRCTEEAEKYIARSEFASGSGSAYVIANRNKWLDDICTHMIAKSSNGFKFIYALIFEETKEIYIGLTNNPEARKIQHFEKGINGEYINKRKQIRSKLNRGEIPMFKVLTDKIVSRKAGVIEQEYIDKFRYEGWEILNIRDAGSLGKSEYWTKNRCVTEANKYKTRKEFRENAPSAYGASSRDGWLSEIGDHWTPIRVAYGFWNSKQECFKVAKEFSNTSEFVKKYSSAYESIIRNGWLNEFMDKVFPHTTPQGFWNSKENCILEAQKYNSPAEFKNGSGGAHTTCIKKGWWPEIREKLWSDAPKANGYWNKEHCREVAMQSESFSDFRRKNGSAYASARINKWIEEFKQYWTKKKQIA